MSGLPIIGRERSLIDRLTKFLHGEAQRRHDYGPIRETPRGATFEVILSGDDGYESGGRRIARVTVEFDRVEQP